MRSLIAELKESPSKSALEPDFFIFNKNSFAINQVQKARLNKTVVLLAKNPSKKVLITGFADQTGSSEYNVWISQQRANAVKDYLMSMGIDESRIISTYLGDTQSTTIGPADRRVEVSLID
jgi:outer membrane protein OmpA-like peptidoglycan-associated protein